MDIGVEPIPNYGDKFSIDEFHKGVRSGLFTDYDGHGYYATEKEMTCIRVYLPDFRGPQLGDIHHVYPNIIWFNR
mgnify:FL=1